MTKQAHPAQLDQVEIFRPGRHTAIGGQSIDFSAADVAAIAAAYDPALHEAPHVVGLPQLDAPAYGWISGLAVNDAGRLVVTASRQVNPAFAEQLASGAYKKRSASFYAPTHPNNPTPGSWYLKHVGWLGATPPAVKGLADPAFGDAGQADAEVLTFGDWEDELTAGLFVRLREWFIGQFGADTADRVLPSYEVQALQRMAMQPETEADPSPASPTPAYADPTGDPAVTTAAELAARAAALDAREAALAGREADQATLVTQARNAGLAQFAEGLVGQGRLLPGERAGLLVALQGLSADTEVEFAEADGAAPIKATPLDTLKKFLAGLPPRVDFSERARDDGTAGRLDLTDAAALQRAATEFADSESKAGRTVSYPEALEHVVAKAGGAPAHKAQG